MHLMIIIIVVTFCCDTHIPCSRQIGPTQEIVAVYIDSEGNAAADVNSAADAGVQHEAAAAVGVVVNSTGLFLSCGQNTLFSKTQGTFYTSHVAAQLVLLLLVGSPNLLLGLILSCEKHPKEKGAHEEIWRANKEQQHKQSATANKPG